MARLPRIRGSQSRLRDPAQVEAIKQAMLAGTFRFNQDEGRIGGFVDARGVYYVMDGHHRMVAALEIYDATGDDRCVLHLLAWGVWDECERPPPNRPMPARNLLRRFRNRLGF